MTLHPVADRPRPGYPPARPVGVALGMATAMLAVAGVAPAEPVEPRRLAADVPLEPYLRDDMVDLGPPRRPQAHFPMRREHRTAGIIVGVARLRPMLSATVLRRYIRHWRPRLEGCYEAELSRRPRLRGRAVMRIVLVDGGLPRSVTVERSTMRAEGLDRCLADAFRQIRFPVVGGSGRTIVTYPLVFRPRRQRLPGQPRGP